MCSTGKREFKTLELAQVDADRVWKESNMFCRPYYCNQCSMYHVTSLLTKTRKRRQQRLRARDKELCRQYSDGGAINSPFKALLKNNGTERVSGQSKDDSKIPR